MKPVVFEGCFGWLHSASGKRGVLLCGPLGEEASVMHRSWRQLAERLAGAGLPTLRFDYLGTGDSTGDSPGPGQVDAWLQSVCGAVRLLLRDAAVEKVTLIGFRFGATLAVACAERLGGVDELVLLAPVTSGRAYCRELSILAKLKQAGMADDPSHPLEAHGIPLTAQTVADLEKFEILQNSQRIAARALILTRDDMATDPHFADRFRKLGVEVEEGEFTDFSRLRWHEKGVPYPSAAFERVAQWIAPGTGPTGPQAVWVGEVSLPVAGICETARMFGPAPGLFGVTCEPPEPQPGDRPALIFVSPGSTPHVGDERMWVTMARRFARAGFTSLRFDIAGVGDSPAPAAQAAPVGHIGGGIADVRTALNWLETRGFDRAILIGNCLGAKVACNVSLIEPRIVGQFLINPWHQFWTDGESDFHTAAHYLRLTRDQFTWRSILSGAVPLSVLLPGAHRMARVILAALARRILGIEAPHQAAAPAAVRSLRSLAERGVDTVLIYGERDLLVGSMEDYFGVARDRLAEHLLVSIRFLPGVNHLFPRRSDRDRLAAILAEHLHDRYPGQKDQPSLPDLKPPRAGS